MKRQKPKMPLDFAKTFLAAATSKALSNGQFKSITWEREGRNIAAAYFLPNDGIVQISETKQFADTVFEGKEALSLAQIGQAGKVEQDTSSGAMLMIDPDAVDAAFLACLYKEEELKDGQPPTDAVTVEGIWINLGFHPQRLESFRQQIQDWLLALPHAITLTF
jgi:hypothetical protein